MRHSRLSWLTAPRKKAVSVADEGAAVDSHAMGPFADKLRRALLAVCKLKGGLSAVLSWLIPLYSRHAEDFFIHAARRLGRSAVASNDEVPRVEVGSKGHVAVGDVIERHARGEAKEASEHKGEDGHDAEHF